VNRCEHITPALQHQLHYGYLLGNGSSIYKLASLAFRVSRRPYNLYCVGADVKPYSINQYCLAWRRITWLAIVSWLLFPDGDPAVRGATRLPMYHVRTAYTFGDRSFAAAGPHTWNELPFSLRDTGLSLTTFNEHYFEDILNSLSRFETTAPCDICDFFAPFINLLTYLLTCFLSLSLPC